MQDFMAVVGHKIGELLVSFRDSMRALVDGRVDGGDFTALVWITSISLVIVLVSTALRAQEKRRLG